LKHHPFYVFKEKYSEIARKENSERIMKENPGSFPVVINIAKRSKFPEIKNGKFMISGNMTLS